MLKPKTDNEDLIEEPGKGHNSFSKDELTRICENLERLADEKANIQQDIKATMEVAAQKGFDKTMIRETLKARAMDPDVLKEREDLRDLYFTSMGLI